MGRDPKHEEGATEPSSATDPTSDTARRRKLASSLLKASTPASTDRSLDAFIARANEELADLASAPFKPERREELLRRELEQLQATLVQVEARATAADARAAAADARAVEAAAWAAARRGSHRWGLTIAAFLIGGAAMFAVSLVLPPKDRPAAAEAPVVTAPTVTAPVVTAPTVTPIAPATSGIMVQPLPDPEPIGPPAVPDPNVADQAVSPPVTEKITKKPAGKPGGRRPAAREDAATAPKPPQDDLYNPF